MIEIEQIPLKSKPWRFSKPLRQEEALGCPGCGASQTTGGVQIEQASVSLMGSCWDQQHTLAGCRQVLLHYPRELSKPLVFQGRSSLGGRDLRAGSRQGCSSLHSLGAVLEAVCQAGIAHTPDTQRLTCKVGRSGAGFSLQES